MTVFDNVGFGLKIRKLEKAKISDRVHELLRLVQLDGLADRYPSHSPAVSASAWPWPGRWRSSRRCCCSTSRLGRSTRRCARTCAPGCATCTTTAANNVYGYESTLPVTVDELIPLARAVVGSPSARWSWRPALRLVRGEPDPGAAYRRPLHEGGAGPRGEARGWRPDGRPDRTPHRGRHPGDGPHRLHPAERAPRWAATGSRAAATTARADPRRRARRSPRPAPSRVVLEMVPGDLAPRITASCTSPPSASAPGRTAMPRCWSGRTCSACGSGKMARVRQAVRQPRPGDRGRRDGVRRRCRERWLPDRAAHVPGGAATGLTARPAPRDREAADDHRPRPGRDRSLLAPSWRSRDAASAYVPTMGALHAGPPPLMRAGPRSTGDAVVVSIFVNPLQFGPDEDYARYPRQLEADLEICRDAGVDVVFAPTVSRLLSRRGRQVTRQRRGRWARSWKARRRPGHFDGVLTVVQQALQHRPARRRDLRPEGRPAARLHPADGRPTSTRRSDRRRADRPRARRAGPVEPQPLPDPGGAYVGPRLSQAMLAAGQQKTPSAALHAARQHARGRARRGGRLPERRAARLPRRGGGRLHRAGTDRWSRPRWERPG